MTVPADVTVTTPEVGPEAWSTPVGDRTVLIRFWPEAVDGKRPHQAFMTASAYLVDHPVTPDDLDRVAAMFTAAATRQRAATPEHIEQPSIFEEVAS